jgi:hypothetical protein
MCAVAVLDRAGDCVRVRWCTVAGRGGYFKAIGARSKAANGSSPPQWRWKGLKELQQNGCELLRVLNRGEPSRMRHGRAWQPAP